MKFLDIELVESLSHSKGFIRSVDVGVPEDWVNFVRRIVCTYRCVYIYFLCGKQTFYANIARPTKISYGTYTTLGLVLNVDLNKEFMQAILKSNSIHIHIVKNNLPSMDSYRLRMHKDTGVVMPDSSLRFLCSKNEILDLKFNG